MPSGTAFSWQPGVLEWLLVLELVVLVTMAAFRYLAGQLARSDPRDVFVIFYRVFWQAMQHPRRYPVPVNYQPAFARAKKPVIDDSERNLTGLTDEELDAIMGGMTDSESPASSQAESQAGSLSRAVAGGGGSVVTTSGHGDDADDGGIGGTLQSLLAVRVETAGAPGLRSFQGNVLVVNVDVPPEDGRANAAIIRHLCKALQLQTHQVAILDGHIKPDKVLRISGLSPQQLSERLALLDPRREAPCPAPPLAANRLVRRPPRRDTAAPLPRPARRRGA